MAKYKSRFTGEEIDNKIGDALFDPTTYNQILFASTEDKMAYLSGDTSVYHKVCPFEFTGTVRRMTVVNLMDSKNLYYTQMSEKAIITVGFKSEEKGITDAAWSEATEDARITVEIDRGLTGKYETIVSEQLVLNGNTLSVDVFRYLATGNNRVRVTAVGVDTGSSGYIVYTALLTSMYIAPANFKWNVPFIEGNEYQLGGLYIGGALDKILKIKVSNEQTYLKTYEVNMGTQTHTSIAYYYGGLEFPTEGTGIYTVEMWLDANGLESEHLSYNIMCVAAGEVNTAQLIAVSNVLQVVKNFDTNKLYSYAVYNGGASTASPTVNVSAIINNTPTSIIKSEVLDNVQTGIINDYIVDLEIDTQETNVQLYSSIELGESKQEAVYRIDNSASFPAVGGAMFYLNPANRNNAQANRTTIINESNLAGATHEYAATWENVSFTDGMDGWTVDNEGRKCLRLPAGCKMSVDYAPFANARTRTVEVSYRVENTSDFNEDVISMATDLTEQFVGVRIKPTNVLLHSSLLRTDDLMQGYNTKDEELVHLLVTVIQNYKQIGNLAQIYVNGVKKCSFEWSTSDTFAHNGKIDFGSKTSDLCIYKCRVYSEAFDWIMATQNFKSCLPDTASKKAADAKMRSVINDGNQLDFDQVKNNGFNYFVLRLPQGASLPSILSQTSVKHSRLEINIQQNPSFAINGVYDDEETEGQGTTAMNYFRWNLRWKTEIIRITAKKNVASSMHSHKMGGTALFNDLNRMIVGPNEADARVAVEQYGAYGFLEVLKEGTTDQYTYIPIGLYTIGQDKGDKTTFGYNNKTYKDTLIHLEGTDHSPKAVGMDYPWRKISVATNADGDSNLGVTNLDGSVIAAWEIGACGAAETDAEQFAYLESEFKPAYDVDYRNTSMLVGLEQGVTIDDVNANLSEFRATETDLGYTNADCLIWIDGEYDTYYYDVIQGKYIKDGLNILTDLGISAADLTDTVEDKTRQIRLLRMQRYRDTMENYWHLRDSLFHYCFIVLFAATDNFKKNTYPYKFGTLESGSRWRWRQDDLDTMFDINNQGLANKIYSLMNGDKSGTTHLFRGNTSYHWTNIQFYYENEIKSMMLEILTAMASLSDTGDSLIEKAVGCIRKYFWDKAQDYFTKSAYNLDAEWTYEEAWAAMKNGTYKAPVHPLQQSLGDHYEAERAFVELRFIFMASLYGFGAFGVGNDSDTSLGQISFRPAQGDNTFHLTPAINMNPTILVGDSDRKTAGGRLLAGDTAEITISTDGDTSIYIQGADYLSDIGDFSKVNLYAENPSLTVQSKRLQKLKVGDENADNVTTIMKTLTVLPCPSLSEVDARNVKTLTGSIDLSQCPRLRSALFGGSSAGEIILPKGSKIEEFELPDTIDTLSLLNLPRLTANTFEEYEAELDYVGKYYTTNQGVGNKCTYSFTSDTHVAGGLVINIMDIQSITVTGKGGKSPRLWCFVDSNAIILSCAAESASATNLQLTIPQGAKKCIVQFMAGTTYKVVVEEGVIGGLQYNTFQALTYLRVENNANISGYGLLKATIEDGAELKNIRIIGFDYEGDANDLDLLAELAKRDDSGQPIYQGIDSDGSRNPNIIPVIEGTLHISTPVYEDSLEVLTEAYGNNLVLDITGGHYIRFADQEVLNVLLAHNVGDGTGITTEQAEAVTGISGWFRENTIITSFEEFSKFIGVTSIMDTSGGLNGAFRKATSLAKILFPNSLTVIGRYAFDGCTSLKSIGPIRNITSIGVNAFKGCTSLSFDELNLPNLTSLGQNAFYGVKIKKLVLGSDGVALTLPSATTATHNYGDKSVLEEVELHGVTSIPSYSFYNYTNMIIKDLNMQTLTSIGNSAFRNTKIENVSNLGSIVTLGNGNSGGDGVFQDCTSLTRVVLPEGLTTIGGYAFSGCTSLAECNIPSTVTSIMLSAFAGTALKRIIIPEGVTIINSFLCSNCSQLELLDIPSTITNLEWQILKDSSATTLICRATTPPSADGEALRYSNLVNIYVPDSSVEAYKNASMWVNSANKIKPLSEYDVRILTYNEDGASGYKLYQIASYDTAKNEYVMGIAVHGDNGDFVMHKTYCGGQHRPVKTNTDLISHLGYENTQIMLSTYDDTNDYMHNRIHKTEFADGSEAYMMSIGEAVEIQKRKDAISNAMIKIGSQFGGLVSNKISWTSSSNDSGRMYLIYNETGSYNTQETTVGGAQAFYAHPITKLPEGVEW